ncbi:ADAM family mig-17-like [Brachionus plicatilis]|uniref:ADAM family mig-17-like n=1 Tax=Brachionus plicatilis TaxID=10195 RepID=A0A3M7SEV9_BRAPC|nr:ADAM family mig-17-like [Brachionus plicatilis]
MTFLNLDQIGDEINSFRLIIRHENTSNFPQSFSIIINHGHEIHLGAFFPDPLIAIPNINLLNQNDQSYTFNPNKRIEYVHYKDVNGNGYATVVKNSSDSFFIFGGLTSDYQIFSILPNLNFKRSRRSIKKINHRLFRQNLTDFNVSCQTQLNDIIQSKQVKLRSDRIFNGGPLIINVETLAVLDISIFNYYKNLIQSNDLSLILEHIRVYYAHVINSVNQKFQNSLATDPDLRINVRLTNILVASNAKESIWTDRSHVGDPSFPIYGNREVIIIGKALSKLGSYLNSLELNFEFDHAVGITRKDLWTDFIRNDITGGTINAGVCHDQMKYSIVEEYNPAIVPYIIAHEIGHNLGGLHDGEGRSSACSSADNYILSANPSLSKNFANLQKFSSCSIANFKQALLTNGYFNPSYICLENDPVKSVFEVYDPKLIGQYWDIDDQCRLKIGIDSTNDFTRVKNLCSNLECNKGFITYAIGSALDGTQCGVGSMCINRVCVKSSKATQSKCPFRDQLIYQWMDDFYLVYELSRTCSQYFSILDSNKYSIYNYCKTGPGSQYCCSLCTIFLQLSCYDTQDKCPTDANSCSQASRQTSCRKSCGLCQVEPVKCKSETFLCENGGKCLNTSQPVNSYSAFKCVCPSGFTGPLCSRKAPYLKTTSTASVILTTPSETLTPTQTFVSTHMSSSKKNSSVFENFATSPSSTRIFHSEKLDKSTNTNIYSSTSKSTKKKFGNKCRRRKRTIKKNNL